jgi:hypothetical protein
LRLCDYTASGWLAFLAPTLAWDAVFLEPCLRNMGITQAYFFMKNTDGARRCIAVVPATQEAEVGGSL